MKRPYRILSILLLLCCSCADPATSTSGDSAEVELQKVSLALNWLPEAEHGGFYAALISGEYEKVGLDVEILPGGPDSPVIQRVATGRVTFGISNADRILLGRAQQANVVGLMAPLQHSPRCIMVHESSEIDSFKDLKNVTLAMSDAAAFSHFLRQQLPLEGVKVVRNSGSLGQFLRDPKFAQQAYIFSEPILAAEQGVKTNTLMVSELGFDPYSSVLFTSQETIESDPELVKEFTAASIAGWKSYLANPAPVHEYIHELNEEMTLSVLDGGLAALRSLCIDDQDNFVGTMNEERWTTLINQLEDLELLKPGLNSDAFLTEDDLQQLTRKN